ncbi:hypothetical protein VNO80_26547 [Phaseolus coccineus]|uniref:Small ribosomal subunit protein cS22 n=1 Tax=Phaseolus coccineus TaxID=3886 RepID=A0AAN9LIP1_PHACN
MHRSNGVRLLRSLPTKFLCHADEPVLDNLSSLSSLEIYRLFRPSTTHLRPLSTTQRRFGRPFVVAEQATVTEAARRLYVGNIPRTVNNDELSKTVQEHGAIEKAEVMYDKYFGRSCRFAFVTMKTVEDANAVIEKLNGTVYVGNLAKTVTTDTLKKFFSEKGKVLLSAKVSRVPGTSKSSGYGFVTFSSEDDVEAAISSFNNSSLEGQKIRVNKA